MYDGNALDNSKRTRLFKTLTGLHNSVFTFQWSKNKTYVTWQFYKRSRLPGFVLYTEWKTNGISHREGGPQATAAILYPKTIEQIFCIWPYDKHPSCGLIWEMWVQNDMLHRVDGPANIIYNQNPVLYEWYVAANKISKLKKATTTKNELINALRDSPHFSNKIAQLMIGLGYMDNQIKNVFDITDVFHG